MKNIMVIIAFALAFSVGCKSDEEKKPEATGGAAGAAEAGTGGAADAGSGGTNSTGGDAGTADGGNASGE
jgi:hypothetical protein